MSEFAIGVDLGGTNLRIAAVNDAGKIVDRVNTATAVSRGRGQVLDEMCSAIQTLVAKQGPGLRGIGIGAPGIIDLHSGMMYQSPNLPGWENYPVRQEIERRLGTTVILENDANAAALGEKWLGAGRDVDDLCMVTLGTGVGGGIVLGGRIWHGMTGMAGELGHSNVDPEGPPCGCGSRGCLEQFASATAVLRMAAEASAAGKAPALAQAMRSNQEFSAKKVYQLAMQGDEASRQIFNRVGDALGIALAGLVNILNLPMYVVGGGVASSWDAFAPSMLERVRENSFVYRATAPDSGAVGTHPRGKTIITRAILGSDAGLVGAARLPMLAG